MIGNEWALESHRPSMIPNCAIYSVTLLSDPCFPFWRLAWGLKWGNRSGCAWHAAGSWKTQLSWLETIRALQTPPFIRMQNSVQPQADSQPFAVTAGPICAPRRWLSCPGCDLCICSVLRVLSLSGVQSSWPLPLQVYKALSRSLGPDVFQNSEFSILQKDNSVLSAL